MSTEARRAMATAVLLLLAGAGAIDLAAGPSANTTTEWAAEKSSAPPDAERPTAATEDTTTTTTTEAPPVTTTTIAPPPPPAPAPERAPAPPLEARACAQPGGGQWAIPYATVVAESGGNYCAANPGGCSGRGCWGAYQFDPLTWGGAFGVANPLDASPDQQDARAAEVYAGGAGCSHWAICR